MSDDRLDGLLQNLREMERYREAYWLRFPQSTPLKLRWRALAARHSFHITPGQSIMELGAGSGLWTQHLSECLKGENPISAVVFDEAYRESLNARNLPNVSVSLAAGSVNPLPAEKFDYVVGTGILCHTEYATNLAWVHDLLKPGGQMLFFEQNFWNPQVMLKGIFPKPSLVGNAPCQIGMRRFQLMKIASAAGFTRIETYPYDVIHPRTPRSLIRFLQDKAIIFEYAPVLKELCGTLCIWATKPGGSEQRTYPNLADHRELFGKVSIVVPCFNEETNVGPLKQSLFEAYGPYIREIVFVDDNSQDRTAEAVEQLAEEEPRVKLVRRKPPNGVGRALRDGYAAATGEYIFSMDCDFAQIIPEFRDMFDALAEGYDGAFGSRFSHDSILVNYPFAKLLGNRVFHLLVKLLLFPQIRDISNNLKLCRSHVLKSLQLEEQHFAANAETGLKPLLAGHRIKEVPISWINRTHEMGRSSFRVFAVAPAYFFALARLVWRGWRRRRSGPSE